MRSRCGPAVALALLVSSGLSGSAGAHGRSHSYSSWHFEAAGAVVVARVRTVELTRLTAGSTDPWALSEAGATHFGARLGLRAGDAPCTPVSRPQPRAAREGWSAWEWRVTCPTSGPLRIESRILHEQTPTHLHFVRVALADGSVQERVLSQSEPRWELGDATPSPTAGPAGTSLSGYLALGVEHILSGSDHLAFVLALLLLAASLGEVATLVTGFTLAHSVTLGLAVLGLVRPEAAAVEALIGFSIALVAAENGWLLSGRGRAIPWLVSGGLALCALLATRGVGVVPAATLLGLALFCACHFGLLRRSARPARLRTAVAFAFGLVHGFGFAGVLAEMQLPPGRVAAALFGFNVGVELGQLAVVALAWPALRVLGRAASGRWQRPLTEFGSAAICGLGLFWFVSRTFG